MLYDEILVQRVRETLSDVPRVVEKRMFGSIAFMVNGKMCVNAGKERLMCRIDPAMHAEALKKKGCQTVIMKGKEYKGYVFVSKEGMKTKEDFDYWIGLALVYNKKAKASTSRKRSKF
jgi:TfoX/Sxy family transcriptional regulator of competence genes